MLISSPPASPRRARGYRPTSAKCLTALHMLGLKVAASSPLYQIHVVINGSLHACFVYMDEVASSCKKAFLTEPVKADYH